MGSDGVAAMCMRANATLSFISSVASPIFVIRFDSHPPPGGLRFTTKPVPQVITPNRPARAKTIRSDGISYSFVLWDELIVTSSGYIDDANPLVPGDSRRS
jgi:hypothetical protein